MVYCLERIWPLIKKQIPTAKLRIVGRHPRPDLVALAKKQKDVEMTGQVEDIRKAVQGARIFLCPIRIGSGMKNKILESLAMGIPVITTSEGAAGIKFENGRVGYIADTNESFAQYTLDLLTSKKKWESFSKAARESVEKEYTWESKSQRLSSILLA